LHEQMIGTEDSYFTYQYPEYFKILSPLDRVVAQASIKDGVKVEEGFTYTSDNNDSWMTDGDLESWLANNKQQIDDITR